MERRRLRPPWPSSIHTAGRAEVSAPPCTTVLGGGLLLLGLGLWTGQFDLPPCSSVELPSYTDLQLIQ
ncbi:unnamed protein product [Pleuronectes platessa]|uniref:Uncharacterized protein n=1 Tax=Pleuronectes platessa TaxID=8262 RepID=A0A9N7V6R8_PLEPL|nr:unnamed protein product [Pleuronectes platessa]